MKLIRFLFLLFPVQFFAQTISFVPVFNGERISLSSRIESIGDWIEFDDCRFYISHLVTYSSGKVWKEDEKAHLIDLEENSSLILTPLSVKIDSISFLIGIDSTTNVSGILDGDLDPINGMYWAWNSGYINFKLQGKSSKSSAADKSFEFHLGGYLSPFQTVQSVTLPVKKAQETIEIEIDLSRFVEQVDLTKMNSIMIPGKDAVHLSEFLPLIFQVK